MQYWQIASMQLAEKMNEYYEVMNWVGQMPSLYVIYIFKQVWHILLISTQ